MRSAVAVAVCRRCLVRSACLADAELHEQRDGFQFGIRGGLLPEQRRARQLVS